MSGKTVKKRILFICTHNSARSQIAEGLVNALYHDRYEAVSAGTEKTSVNPYAIRVMDELGIDISRHRSKLTDEFLNEDFDYIITVCDNANENCPYFPGGKERIHKSFEDPSGFKGDDEEKVNVFRRVRDEIKEWVEKKFSD